MNGSLAELFGPVAPPFIGDLWQVTIAAARADHPLSPARDRPDRAADGPHGNAANREAAAAAPLPLDMAGAGGCCSPSPRSLLLGRRADDDVGHGRHDHLRPVLQHAAGTNGPAVVRPCGLLRPRRLRRHPRDERRHPRQARRAGGDHADRRRSGGARLRRPVRPRFDQARRPRLFHDLARHRRTGVLEFVHPAHVLRRRGGNHHQSRQAGAAVRAEVRAADRSLLSHRDLVLPLHRRDVRADPHAVRTDLQRGARQPGARAIYRLFRAENPPHRLQLRGLLRRNRGGAGGDQFRNHELRSSSARSNRPSCC